MDEVCVRGLDLTLASAEREDEKEGSGGEMAEAGEVVPVDSMVVGDVGSIAVVAVEVVVGVVDFLFLLSASLLSLSTLGGCSGSA